MENYHRQNPWSLPRVLACVPSAGSLASVPPKLCHCHVPLGSNFLLHRETKTPPPTRQMDWALARMLSLDRKFKLENKIRPSSLMTFSVPFHLETLWFSSGFRMNSDSDPLGNAQPTRTPHPL